MTRIYISGPMTGKPELNFPAFHAAAAKLRALGYEVINPAELDLLDKQKLTWQEYMRRDIKVLVDCDAIALLPGWEKSKGARAEKYIADLLNLRPTYLGSFTGKV